MKSDRVPSDGDFIELAEFFQSHPVNDEIDLADALSAAIMREDTRSVLLLLDNGANPNCRPKEHMPPLHCAVEQKNSELVRLLCGRGADIDYPTENGFTPLHLAVDVEADTAWQRGQVPTGELVELLLKLGANPNSTDHAGITPLNIAEQYGFSLAVNLLTERGRRQN